jgi:hypothetical protein
VGHNGGLKAVFATLAYVEQQKMAAATEVLLLFRHWCHLATKKKGSDSEANTHYSFLQKTNSHL